MISALDFENEYVHTAYELLARILEAGAPKIWPFVNDFIEQFQTGSIIADVGCGEGKYLQSSTRSWMIGTDRSFSLSAISRSNGHEISTCDITKMPFRGNVFDGIVCISVIHHLATETRRIKALKELARLLKPGGKMLITAWALENEYRKFICQDVLVPADIVKTEDKPCIQTDTLSPSSFSNLSFDFIKNHATRITAKLGGIQDFVRQEVESFKSKLRTASNVTETIQNYFVNRKRSIWLWVEDRTLLNKLGYIFRSNLRKTHSSNDLTSVQREENLNTSYGGHNERSGLESAVMENPASEGIHRYYHVFQKGELSRLVKENVPDLELSDEWFEQGNWVIVARKKMKAQACSFG